MKRHLFLLLFILFVPFCLNAQDQTNITISGAVFDDITKEIIESGSIRLLNASDSSYVTGATTDEHGKFKLTVKSSRYIVQVSFMGFISKYYNVNPSKKNANLGQIFLKENSVMLKEAVVTAQAVEILVKGDTVEYNADSYKVQESAVLEDLVKKIPGAEVDENGKITINGKEISKILVDGKEFFSDDPKIASKNLPAKMIEKLQVLDKRSDLAQLTGFDDGNEETVINLTVKPGMKEGLFGSFLGGYGTKDRYEGNGMVNYMRNNTQITALGGLNNTNNAGFTDFASSGQNGPPRGVRFGANNGVAKTNNLGFNFATGVKDKLKVNGDVRLGGVDNDVKTESERTYDLQQARKRVTNISNGNNRSNNFATNFKFEWTPDSFTTVIFRPQLQYNTNKSRQISNGQSYYADSNPSIDYTQDSTSYTSNTEGISLNGDLMVSRKLSRSGRSITFRVEGGYSDSDKDGFDYSSAMFRFRDYPTKADSLGAITDQRFFQDDKSHNWRTSVTYVEPLGRNNFLELNYSFRNNNSITDKKVYSSDGVDYSTLVDSVTRKMDNDFNVQNITLNFQSIRNKFNYMVGIGLEPSSTKSDIIEPNTINKKIIPRRSYLNFAPNARFNYAWDKRHNLRIDYRGSTSQPSTRQLFDGDYTNTATVIERGNPKLEPSFQNRVTVRYQKFDPVRASAFMVFARFNQTLNDIAQISSWEGPKNVTTYKNVNGNMSASTRIIYNTPLRNRKFSLNSMSFLNYNRSNSFVTLKESSDIMKNTSNRYTIQEHLGLRFTSTYLDFTTRGNIAYNKVKNNVSTSNNQSVYDYGGYADFTVHLPFNFHVDSDLTYSANSGYKEGFERKEWLWNASISKDIFKAKNGTIRVKIYDILKERSNISWSSGNGYNEYTKTNTINSYVMFNFVYRFQSFKGGAKMPEGQNSFRGPGGGGRRHQ